MNESCEATVVKHLKNEVIRLAGCIPAKESSLKGFFSFLHDVLSKYKCHAVGNKEFHSLSQNYHSETGQMK